MLSESISFPSAETSFISAFAILNLCSRSRRGIFLDGEESGLQPCPPSFPPAGGAHKLNPAVAQA